MRGKTGSWKSPAQDTKTSVAVDLAGAEADGLLDGRIALVLNLAGTVGLCPERVGDVQLRLAGTADGDMHVLYPQVVGIEFAGTGDIRAQLVG